MLQQQQLGIGISISAAARRTFTNRSNCIASARRSLGSTAQVGVHFEVYPTQSGLSWRQLNQQPVTTTIRSSTTA
jgi:hypothetical protein